MAICWNTSPQYIHFAMDGSIRNAADDQEKISWIIPGTGMGTKKMNLFNQAEVLQNVVKMTCKAHRKQAGATVKLPDQECTDPMAM